MYRSSRKPLEEGIGKNNRRHCRLNFETINIAMSLRYRTQAAQIVTVTELNPLWLCKQYRRIIFEKFHFSKIIFESIDQFVLSVLIKFVVALYI